MKWTRFKETVQKYGFTIGYLRNFEGHGWSYNGGLTNEEEIIFYNRENGLVLYANSFGRTAINQAILYGEIDYTCSFNGKQKTLIARCRTTQRSGNVLSFSMEVGKGFEHYVTRLEESFNFCTPWSIEKELRFVNYMERETHERAFWKNCAQRKVEQCSHELRAIMCR